jgi:hypothetical protein
LGKKRGKRRRKQKKISNQLQQNFSATQTAGSSVQSCPPEKHIPCNLIHLLLTEAEASFSGKPGTRVVQIQNDPVLHLQASPTLLQTGGVFQITAPSNANKPRKITLQVTPEALCGGTHPQMVFIDGKGPGGVSGVQALLEFWRPPMATESGMPRLWMVVNSVFMQSAVTYPLSAATCGVPVSKPAVASLGGAIEVYPADVFELELSIPAILKPDSLKFEKKTSSWQTVADKRKEEIKAAGDLASDEYKKSEALQSTGSEGEFRKFFEDLKKKQLGVEDPSYVDELKVKLTQKDGDHSLEAPIDDVIVLVRAILSAEYALKKIDEWIDNFQVGPGVSITFECQFLAGRINARWGYTEYTDERVFLAIAGAIKCDLIKASVDVNAGWKCAGLADAFIALKGEGTISLNLPAVEKSDPDMTLSSSVKPEGELKLSGGIHGALGWVITGDIGFEVSFKADAEDFKVLSDEAILKGKILISREPVYGVYTATMPLYGTTTDKVEVMKGNPKVGEFVFGELHAQP